MPEPFFEIAGIYANKSFNLSRSFSFCNSRIGEEVKGLVVYCIRQCWLNACLSACWEPSTVDYFSVAIVFCIKVAGLFGSLHHFLQLAREQEQDDCCRTAHEDKQHEEIKQVFNVVTQECLGYSAFRIIAAQHTGKLVGC